MQAQETQAQTVNYNHKHSLGWSLAGAFALAGLFTPIAIENATLAADLLLSGGLPVLALAGAGMARSAYKAFTDARNHQEGEGAKDSDAFDVDSLILAVPVVAGAVFLPGIIPGMFLGALTGFAGIGLKGLVTDGYQISKGTQQQKQQPAAPQP